MNSLRRFFFCTFLSLSFLPGSKALGLQIDLDKQFLSNQKTYLLKTTEGKRLAGRVDTYDRTGLVMTRRNGRIAILEPKEISSIRKVDDEFYSKTFDQIRVKLQKEFGSKYQVSATKHFLVVHPPGSFQKWALPFEQLFVRFGAYFKTRGLTIKEPEFPMVAVVLRTRNEFVRMAKQHNMQAGVVGYYSFHSNRLITYQQSMPWNDKAANEAGTTATIIHEATHQTAANTGIHSRLGVNPRWLSEGLATMFEAKGVNNYFEHPEFETRVNWERLGHLRELYREGAVAGTVEQLVGADSLFTHDPKRAYAVSWAMSLYLAERDPHRYVQYIHLLQKEPLTSSINRSIRMKYFNQSFGSPESIEADLKRFIERIPDKPSS